MTQDDELERRLRAEALRPVDPDFTRRVLQALPTRSPARSRNAVLARSLVQATRLAFVLALIAAAQRWFSAGPASATHVLVFLLFAVPVLAALSQLCGPLIPQSLRQSVWRAGRHWR